VPSGAGRAARDDEGSAPCVGCHGITQPSSRITSTPAAGSGAGAGQFSHWPHPSGGASLSGISTAAARSPAAWAGTDGTVDAVVAAVVTTAATATSCRDSVATAVPRGGSVVAAALPAACGSLDECRFVGIDASDLSALAGARSHPANGNTRLSSSPSKSRAPRENATYLKLEKPRFLFLEGSGAAAAAPASITAALVGTSAVRATSSPDCPVAGATTPVAGACSSAASTALGDGGGGFNLSGARPLSLSSEDDDDDDEFSGVVEGESPCCSRSRYSSLCCSRRSRRWILLSFLRAAHSCSRRCAARATAQARGVGGSDREASMVTLC
jgi:hypothetical protein